jgi:site-specific recombinase XerD
MGLQLSQARDKYMRWLLATRDLSPHTIRAYDGDLARFERSLGPLTTLDRIDRNSLLGFLEEQRDSGLASASLRRRASALHGFCQWLLKENLVPADPWRGTRVSFGRSRSLPRVLSAHELHRLLAFLRLSAGLEIEEAITPDGVRHRPHEATTLLAVVLMLVTGVRVHEVVGLRCRDIDLDSRTMRLIGKGNRERQVFLTNDWITSFTAVYIKAREGFDTSHPQLLFNVHYEPMSAPAIRSRVAKAAAAAGLATRVTPHMLRHTAATQLIEAGVDIRYIQRLLGHANLSTTEIYTHVSDRALKHVVSQADVLGRLARADN